MPEKKKPAKKATPKGVSKAEFEALAKKVEHIEIVLSNRLGFKPDVEPEDLIESGVKP